jgi:phosphate transport system substrate-binding protein
MALELVYIPLPDSVVNQIQASWKSNIKDQSGKSVW